MIAKTKQNSKAVVVLSGGLDSTTLLYDVIHIGYEAYPISFDYGQRHKKELVMAGKTCKDLGLEHKVLDLSALNAVAPSILTRAGEMPTGHYSAENMKQTVVPNRNMVMLSLATAYAIGIGAEDIFYGAHAGDHAIYPDCRREFVHAMEFAIKKADWSIIRLHAPYLDADKGDIVKRGLKLGVNYANTWTCYEGQDLACGKCGSCNERLEAFEKAGTKDPLRYRK